MSKDVFISYSRLDAMIADRICDAFDSAGISYFIDRKGITGGADFQEKIADAITDCRIFLYLASENTYNSKYINLETSFAVDEKEHSTIFPYVIDGSELPKKLRFLFSGINRRTIEEHPVDTVLVNDILRLLGREASVEIFDPVRPSKVPGGLSSGTVTVGAKTSAISQAEINKIKGSADALYNQKRFEEAYKLYIKAADAGDSWAQFRVGWMASRGEGTPVNKQMAIKYYLMSANQGYVYAQYNLGCCYDDDKNYAEAYKWYLKAAEKDYASAMINLSFLLTEGNGCNKDLAAAFRWHQKLADMGDIKGYNMLGNDYYSGSGVAVDYDKAFINFKRAADGGNVLAISNVGLCYEYGYGVAKNIELAKKYYKEAADKGNDNARKKYAKLTSSSNDTSDKSVEDIVKEADRLYDQGQFASAYDKYLIAADRGNSWAQFRVGWMANNAEGTSKDKETARRYYRMSADNGYRYAQYNLALIYQDDKNYEEVCRLYRKAAVQGHESSMYWLGMALREGEGCTKDEKEAHMWFSKLADEGDSRGLSALGDDYYYGYGVEIDNKKAADCYRKAADKGHAYSMYSLGWCYEKGKGVAANLAEARKWYRKGADAGNSSAKKALDRIGNSDAATGSTASASTASLSSMTEKELIDKANALYNDKNYAEALRYYDASASRYPNSSVWVRMGFMYETAKGTAADYTAAKKYYELAAEKGDVSAWVYIGHLYYNGKLAKDYNLAEKYYKKAEAKGDANGAAWMGVLYHYGLGRPVDKAMARRYYDKAASLGSKLAEEERAKL